MRQQIVSSAAVPSMCRCGHPTSHHDAGECWTGPDGAELYDGVDGQCKCSWWEPVSGADA